jgi:hypothetical protein
MHHSNTPSWVCEWCFLFARHALGSNELEPAMQPTTAKKSKPRRASFVDAPLAADATWGTIDDVARTRRLSRFAIYNAIHDGRVKAKKAGSRTLINLPSVDAYLDALPDVEARP